MSTRKDIQDGSRFESLTNGLVYTEVLGWIDMGHARGDDIRSLRRQFLAGENGSSEPYTVIYRQDMRIHKFSARFGVGKFSRWEIQRGRSQDEIKRIMLAMMMNTSWKFENLQSLKLFSWYTDSGFSGEDLVSDLLGFYRAVLPGLYSYRLKPVSYESALRRWDYYGAIGSHKNDGFRPVHFPDPVDRCVKLHPYKGHLPKFLTWIQPWNDFTSGIVKPITNDGSTLEFVGLK